LLASERAHVDIDLLDEVTQGSMVEVDEALMLRVANARTFSVNAGEA
jgi:hypothetical protein